MRTIRTACARHAKCDRAVPMTYTESARKRPGYAEPMPAVRHLKTRQPFESTSSIHGNSRSGVHRTALGSSTITLVWRDRICFLKARCTSRPGIPRNSGGSRSRRSALTETRGSSWPAQSTRSPPPVRGCGHLNRSKFNAWRCEREQREYDAHARYRAAILVRPLDGNKAASRKSAKHRTNSAKKPTPLESS